VRTTSIGDGGDGSTEPGDYPFRHAVRVRFAETDAMGIVHHSRYLPYLEEARVAYLRHLERPYTVLREEGLEMAVLEAYVRYRSPLRFDEIVDVHLGVASATRTTFRMAYLLTVDGDVRATAATVHGCVTPSGRPTRMPAWLRDLAGLAPRPTG
jgi:acyl-CoA thioester hydrolase